MLIIMIRLALMFQDYYIMEGIIEIIIVLGVITGALTVVGIIALVALEIIMLVVVVIMVGSKIEDQLQTDVLDHKKQINLY